MRTTLIVVTALVAFVECASYDFSKFQDWEYMNTYLEGLSENAEFTDRFELKEIGVTYENRSIWLAKIGQSITPRRQIWIDAGLHGRDWIAHHTAFYVIEQLLASPELTADTTWYIAPNINPDGYAFTWTSTEFQKPRYWRKNRSPEKCKLYFNKLACCRGVDLNRNFDFDWADEYLHTTGNPCLGYYHGERPFDQPETQAVRNFVRSQRGNLDIFITLHAYGQQWILPYAYTKYSKPYNYESMLSVAKAAVGAIENVNGANYSVGSAAELLGGSPGGIIDWVTSQGVRYVYGIILPPEPLQEETHLGFLVAPENVQPIADETWVGIQAVRAAVEFESKSSA